MNPPDTSPVGTWQLTIKTPIGTQDVTLTLVEIDGKLEGTAAGALETVSILDAHFTTNRLTWRQSITKPMRLNLNFDVHLNGDHLAGTSKAGRLPKSKVTGTRSH